MSKNEEHESKTENLEVAEGMSALWLKPELSYTEVKTFGTCKASTAHNKTRVLIYVCRCNRPTVTSQEPKPAHLL